jgi:aminoglycoside phosphotransferase (APT) family kinase protein
VPTWTAELVVDEHLVRRLLAQFPELEVRSLQPFAEGWDYAIWLVNQEWAFRFPRREVGIAGTRVEIEVLPALAPLLPIPVPKPVFVGAPTDDFPWPFFGARLLPGRELAEVAVDDAERVEIARALGAFLRRLHEAEVAFELPVDQNRRGNMQARVPVAREQLEKLEEERLWHAPASVADIFAAALELPPPQPSAVVHGDLHFRQVLVDENRRVTGVIDWVDIGRRDPGVDLSLYWSYFPPAARTALLDSYGAVTDDQLLRARVLALNLCAILARYGAAEGNAAVRDEALAGLDRAAAT